MIDALHPRLHVCDHPLIRHKLARMRDRGTGTRAFRALLKEIAMLMGYEVMRDLPLAPVDVETPMAVTNASTLEGKKLAIVPILRAGLGMADGFLELIPPARVGHIGLYRDHDTKRPVEYLRKLPEADDRLFIIVDPMLATGYSAAAAVDAVKAHGVDPQLIRFVALVAAPEGLAVMAEQHPEIPVFVAAVDEGLDENAYIVPGLGDAGDRLFGTK